MDYEYDEDTEMTIDQANRVNTLLHDRDMDNFARVLADRMAADPELQDPAEQVELNKLFQERVEAKGAKNAAQWVAHFEDIRAERRAAKNAPKPEPDWKNLSDEDFAKAEAKMKAEKREARLASEKSKAESLQTATRKLMDGTADKPVDWLGMSDEEFKAADAKRAALAHKRMLSQI